MATRIDLEGEFACSPPVELFEGRYEEYAEYENPRNYDVSPEGDRFIRIRRAAGGAKHIDVVLNWFAELV